MIERGKFQRAKIRIAVPHVPARVQTPMMPRREASAMFIGVALASLGAGFIVAEVLGASRTLRVAYPLVVFAFVAAGSAVIRSSYRKHDAFSILPMATFFYLLTFAFGSLYYYTPGTAEGGSVIHGLVSRYETDGLIIAVIIGFLGWICFVVGFKSSTWMRAARQLTRPVLTGSGSTAVAFVAVLTFGWAARALTLQQDLYYHYATPGEAATGQFAVLIISLSTLPFIAIALAGIEKFRNSSSMGKWFVPLILIEVAWALPTGERAHIISLGILVAVVRYYGSPRPFPWAMSALALAGCALILFPFVTIYRGHDGSSGYQNNTKGQMAVALEALSHETPANIATTGMEDVASRFSGSASLGALATQGREQFPRTPAETMSDWGSSFVPRFIYPAKSDPGTFGNEFGVAYGIVARENKTGASFTITQPGDFYGSFGWFGLALGMLCAGALYRGIDEYFADKSQNPLTLALFASFIGPATLYMESSFAIGFFQPLKNLFVGVAVMGLAAGLANYVARSGRRQKSAVNPPLRTGPIRP